VTVRYAAPGGGGGGEWVSFHLSSSVAATSSDSPDAAAARPPAGAQRLLSLTSAGQWQLAPRRRAEGAAGYTSLGANEPVARQGRGRRGSVDSGIGL
jgi:hypothetical protein